MSFPNKRFFVELIKLVLVILLIYLFAVGVVLGFAFYKGYRRHANKADAQLSIVSWTRLC